MFWVDSFSAFLLALWFHVPALKPVSEVPAN
jgi:hypothetical protein